MKHKPNLIRLFYGLHSVTSLAYQIIWIKILSTHLGMSIAALGTVLACFVGGLGLGALWLAAMARRQKVNVKKVFGLAQIGLAVWVVLFPFLLKLADHFYVMSAPSIESVGHHAIRILMSAFLLLVPSVLIGLIFPLLSQVQESWQKEPIGQNTGRLFKDGLVWSALGCLLMPAILVPHFGLALSSGLLALVNLSLGFFGLKQLPKTVSSPASGKKRKKEKGKLPLNGVVALGFLLGVGLFAVEVIGAKFLWLTIDATVYAEGILVGFVLILMALGSFLFFLLRKKKVDPFVLLGSGFLLFAGALLVWLIYPAEISQFGKQFLLYETSSVFSFFSSHAVLVLLVMGGPAVASGLIFSALCELVVSNSKSVSDPVGRLTAWHYFGSVLGSLLATFVVLPFIGMTGGLAWVGLVFSFIGCALLATLISAKPIRRLTWAASVIVAVLFLMFETFGDVTFQEEAVPKDRQVLFHHEDGAGLVEVYQDRDFGFRELFSSRLRGEGSDKPEGVVTKVWEGILPVVFHPDPKSVLVVGLGTGISLSGTLQPSIEDVTVVEYSKGVIKAAPLFKKANGDVLNEPRIRLIHQDGRNLLRLSKKTYDVIIQDLFFPYRAGVGNLYTKEHYEQIRAHLNPGGRAAQWIALRQIGLNDLKSLIKTFSTVFPRTTLWLSGRFLLLYGSQEELNVDWPRYRSAVNKGMGLSESEPADFASLYLTSVDELQGWLAGATINTDDNAHIEYRTPLLFKNLNSDALAVENIKAFLPYARSVKEIFTNVPAAIGKKMDQYQKARDLSLTAYIKKEENNAQAALQDALASYRLNPGHYSVRRSLELTYIESAGMALAARQVDGAKDMIKKALSYYPGSRDGRFFLGQIRLDEGKVKEGSQIFEALIEEFPNYFLARLHYAKFLCSSGKKKEGFDHIQAVLNDVPDHRDALWLAHTCN